MPHIAPLAGDELSAEAEELLGEIERAMGRVPNLFRTYAHHPPLLRANWNKLKATMMEGALSRMLKETIALLVSQDNDCEYCVQAHSGALKSLGVDDATLERIRAGDLKAAGFGERDRGLVELMRKVNARPHEVSEADLEPLRAAGISDAELVEACGVMETFVGFNKFLNSLRVELG